ncbi:uncharacterized protein LOC144924222 isoform X2 [Branchiostoma floridae x Branchiostoma belcheri]
MASRCGEQIANSMSKKKRAEDILALQKLKLQSIQREKEALLSAVQDKQDELTDVRKVLRQDRQAREDLVMDRLNGRALKGELTNLYGPQAAPRAVRQYAPSTAYSDTDREPTPLLDDIMTRRQQQHRNKQTEQELELQRLIDEKQSILDRLEQKKRRPRDNDWDTTGEGSTHFPSRHSTHSAQSIGSLVRQTRDNLPAMADNVRALRDYVENKYLRKSRPYNGELGSQSYEPWQMKDFFMVRDIVEELVDVVLDQYFRRKDPDVLLDTYEQLYELDKKDLENSVMAVSRRRAAILIAEEFIIEVTREMTRDTAEELRHIHEMSRAMGQDLVINSTENVTTGIPEGRDPDDPAYDLVTRGVTHMTSERKRLRKEQWNHTQHLHMLGETVAEDDESPEEGDITTLNYLHLLPMNLRESDKLQDVFQNYSQEEAQHFKKMVPDVLVTFKISKRMQGISSAALSPDQRLLALGSVHGDIMVYDVWMEPGPRPIREMRNEGASDDQVLYINWSLDGTRIITINETGILLVWSIQSGGVHREDIKALDLEKDSEGVFPAELTQLLVMDVDEDDFNFTEGPFFENQVQTGRFAPTAAAFHPSMTLFGSQSDLVICLENGDILKCDAEKLMTGDTKINKLTTPRVTSEKIQTGEWNSLASGMEAELLRAHQAPVLLMGNIHNNGDLVTVDSKGYIFHWKYKRRHISSYDWFVPFKKYRLETAERTFTPTSNIQPKIIYTDVQKKQKQEKSRQDLAKERDKAEDDIALLGLEDPWHRDYLPGKDLVTTIYKPTDVTQAGALFHIISRYQSTGQLSTYMTRLYKPKKLPASRILSCRFNTTGTEIFFMLLYPEHPPKPPHVTFVSVDVVTMEMTRLRIDHNLTETEFERCVEGNAAYFDVTRPHDVTGSEYIIAAIAGTVVGYSVNTGSYVLGTRQDFTGCRLNPKEINWPAGTDLRVADVHGRFMILSHMKKQNFVSVLKLQDKNTSSNRQDMWEAYKHWSDVYQPQRWRQEQTMRHQRWALSGRTYVDAELYVRHLLYEMMDRAIQQQDGKYHPDEAIAYKKEDKRTLQEMVLGVQFPRSASVSPAPTRQTSRLPTAGSKVSTQPISKASSRQPTQPKTAGSKQPSGDGGNSRQATGGGQSQSGRNTGNSRRPSQR